MPIGDLLASITGDSVLPARPAPPAPKRKATDDLRSPVVAKAPRTSTGASNGTPRPFADTKAVRRPDQPGFATANPTPRPSQVSKPYTDRLSTGAIKRTTSNEMSRSASAPSNGSKSTSAGTSAKRPAQPPATRTASSPATTASTAPPKKGSYKEMMQRAKRQHEEQAAKGGAGTITHKAVERAPLKSQAKADAALAEIRKAKARPGDRPGYAGTARPGAGDRNGDRLPMRNGHATTGAVKGGKVGGAPNSKGPKGNAPAPVEEKKVKKAATATTGYQGTARGPAKIDKPSTNPGRPSSNARPRMPFQRPRRRDDEYDEDMDDFIDDDDGAEERGGGYGYGYRYAEDEEEDESDMEAGLSDLDQEERRAEREARREDAEQERIEASHRADKARKKDLWAQRRAGA